ncbi:MgtC/SapB family protein [Paenibacillus sp. GCM10023248]|uniref:MgtC/SapB family protein n=1 Tax=Bacillales TaxID=1385 RepID=UPI00237848F3|nr:MULTISPECIES: MgtC/SapB family protein [Bacillales]MDD9269212.1 MgtC/SapB family protein [Paenibacillus sp. MAHUQ-63]
MILSVVLGGLIGLEREWSNHAAGLRTHILVCVGSTTIMLLSVYGFNEFVNEANVRIDPARLAAQVISGIGFLGAGAIMRTGATVSGLTTAASIWVVAAIGLSVGAGFYYVSIMAAVLVLFSLFVLNHWEKYWMRKRRSKEYVIWVTSNTAKLNHLFDKLAELQVQIRHLQVMNGEERSERVRVVPDPETSLKLIVTARNEKLLADITDALNSLEGVLAIVPSVQPNYLGNNPYEHAWKSSLHSK